MFKYKKALLVITLALMMVSCQLPFLVKRDKGTNDANSAAEVTEVVGNPSGNVTEVVGNPTNEVTDSPQATPTATFLQDIHTEFVLPDTKITTVKAVTVYDPSIDSYKTFVLLENNEHFHMHIVTGYTYKVEWFDEKNQVIDQQTGSEDHYIFPSEKYYLIFSPDKSKIAGKKVIWVRIEFPEVTMGKKFFSDAQVAKITEQEIAHPFITTMPGDLRMEYTTTLDTTGSAITPVTVKSTINGNIAAVVVVIYFDAEDKIIGFGGSSAFELSPLGSATVDAVGTHLTAVPARAEYYTVVGNPANITDMLYP